LAGCYGLTGNARALHKGGAGRFCSSHLGAGSAQGWSGRFCSSHLGAGSAQGWSGPVLLFTPWRGLCARVERPVLLFTPRRRLCARVERAGSALHTLARALRKGGAGRFCSSHLGAGSAQGWSGPVLLFTPRRGLCARVERAGSALHTLARALRKGGAGRFCSSHLGAGSAQGWSGPVLLFTPWRGLCARVERAGSALHNLARALHEGGAGRFCSSHLGAGSAHEEESS
jgi:uncharacterized protein YidB (DUF937 family)